MFAKKISSLFSKTTSNRDFKEVLAKGSSALIFRLIGLILSYIFTVLVTRKYGVDAWGVFTLFFAFIQISSKIARFGFDKGAIKFISEYRVKKNGNAIGEFYLMMILIVFILASMFSLITFIFSNTIAEFFYKNTSSGIYIRYAASCILPFSLLTINALSLKGLKQVKEGSFLGHTVLFTLAIIGLLLFNKVQDNNELVILAFIFSVYVSCVLSFFIWFKKSKVSIFSKDQAVKLKEIIKVSLPLIFAGSLFLIMGWADTFMLGFFKSTKEVGAYNVITKVARFSTLIIVAVDSIFSSKITEFSSRNKFKELEKLAVYSSKITFYVTLPIFLIICIFPKQILGVFHDSLEDQVIIYSLMILTLTKFVNAITGNVGSILQLTGKQVAYQNIVITSLCLNLILNYFLIPLYGILGASISSFISILLNNILALFYVKKFYNINASFIQYLFQRN